MAHEKSKTVRKSRESNRWVLKDNSGRDINKVLGPSRGFTSSQATDTYAKIRSASPLAKRPKRVNLKTGKTGRGA